MPVPASIKRCRPEARAAATSSAMRACCGRASNAGRTLASGPVEPKRAATSARTAASVHPRHETLQLLEPLLDLRCVGRLGSEEKVVLQVGHRLGEQGEAEMDHAAVADFLRAIRGDAEEELLDPERHSEVALTLINPPEILDHPLDDLPVARPLQEVGPERHLPAVHPQEERLAFLL